MRSKKKINQINVAPYLPLYVNNRKKIPYTTFCENDKLSTEEPSNPFVFHLHANSFYFSKEVDTWNGVKI